MTNEDPEEVWVAVGVMSRLVQPSFDRRSGLSGGRLAGGLPMRPGGWQGVVLDWQVGRRLWWAGRAGGVARGHEARGVAAGYQALAWARAASERRGPARPSGSHTWSAGLPSVWTPVAMGTSAGGGRRRRA